MGENQCTGITEHERALAEFAIKMKHIEDDQGRLFKRLGEMEARLNHLGWLAAATFGGVALQLFLLLVDLKK